MSEYLSPASPTGTWKHLSICRRATELVGWETHGYQLGHMRVLSSAIEAKFHGMVVPQNHVTLSVDESLARRPTDAELTTVRHDFDMHDAEEDNHQPGRIRNLFLPLHLPRGTQGVCDCKSDETRVVEPDGFVWSRTK